MQVGIQKNDDQILGHGRMASRSFLLGSGEFARASIKTCASREESCTVPM
jgi:hypothetical protein